MPQTSAGRRRRRSGRGARRSTATSSIRCHHRIYAGGSASRTYKYLYAGLPTETTFGIQTRYDAISLGLTHTNQRTFIANIRTDRVGEGSIGLDSENTIHWVNWLRTTLGWRGDYFEGSDVSIYDAYNSGHTQAAIGSPKATMVVARSTRPSSFGAGMGYHSNDVRGTTITEYPVDRLAFPSITSSPIGPSPLLARTRGAEAGVRTKAIEGLDSSVSVFFLDQASELVFEGDVGDTVAGRPSERYGIEFTNDYRPTSWLHFDGNLALSHARFIGYDFDQAATASRCSPIPRSRWQRPRQLHPDAPWLIASAGVTFGETPVRSARCAGVISARRRLPRTTLSAPRRRASSTPGWATPSTTAGRSSSTHSISSTPKPMHPAARLRIAHQIRSALRPVQFEEPAAGRGLPGPASRILPFIRPSRWP